MTPGTSRSSDDTTFDFRECELGVLFGNDDVAVKDHLGSSSKGAAIHCCNDRFVESVPSREGAKPMRHAYQSLLIAGDLSSETSIVSFKPPEKGGGSC